MTDKQRNSAYLRLSRRALAALAVAAVLAVVVTLTAAGSPPANDTWANAITLTGASGSDSGTTVEATTEIGEPLALNAGVTTTRTVWWKWVATSSAPFEFDTAGSGPGTTIAVYTGASVDALTEVASNADGDGGLVSRAVLDATASTTYYIQVGVLAAAADAAVSVQWSANAVVNDDFAAASSLGADDGSLVGWNVGADGALEVGEPDAFGDAGSTVWYAYTPSETGEARFTLDARFVAGIAVYEGSSLVTLDQQAEDHGSPGSVEVTLPVTGGTTYRVQVGSADSGPGNFGLQWQLVLPPVNDDLANADDEYGGGFTQSATNVAATLEAGEPTGVNGHGGVRSVWYVWYPGGSGPATVTVEAEQDVPSAPLVQLYSTSVDDPTFGDLTPIGTHEPGVNDPIDAVHATVDGTKAYYVQVLGDFTAEQNTSFAFTLKAQFDNDLFADATTVAGNNGSLGSTTAGATFPEAGEPDPAGGSDNTVWFAWTASANGPASFDVSSDFGAAAAVYTGSAVGSLVTVDDDSDSTNIHLSFNAQAGVTYHVQVGTYSDTPGPFVLGWSFAPRPANDDWADAAAIAGASGSTNGTNVGATTEAGEPLSLTTASVTTHDTVWWKWVAPSDGRYQFDTTDTGVDTVLGVFTGSGVNALTEVTSNDDNNTGPWQSRVLFTAVGGTTYYLQVGSYGEGETGIFTLEWSNPPANNDFADAIAFSGDTGPLGGSNVGATLQPIEPDPTGDGIASTVWYAWTPASGGRATVSFDAGFGGSLAVYSGSALNSLTRLASDYDGTSLTASFTAAAGQTYRVQVGSYADSPGAFTLDWGIVPLVPQHYVVTTTGDTANDASCLVASCTLRQAVNAARAGGGEDTIEVPAGTYQLSASFGALVVDAGMTITGEGARTTAILAPPGDRVLDVTSAGTPVAIEGFTLSGGTANSSNNFFGGNVRSSGDLTLTEVTVTGGSASSGGGLSNNGGTMLIDRSTVSGNQALADGGDSGGIQNFGDGTHHGALTIRNSTITGNTARLGGAVLSWNDAANTTVVENSTIAFNIATDRGLGGIGGDGSFTFAGSIVAGNVFGAAPSNCSGAISSLGSNLESGTDCGFTAPGDLQSTDPDLGPLADNGGPTDTLALGAASPAVDAVAGGCPPPATDQRGVDRPQGGSCDIGAFELVASPSNDDWVDRAALDGDSGSVDGTTVAATREGFEPDPSESLQNSVWYSWTPSAGGIATFTLTAPFAGSLAVYTGGPIGELTRRADDAGAAPVVQFAASAGTEYSIQVGTSRGETPAAFGLEWSLSVPPGAPDLTAATPGNGSVTLDWQPPQSNGGMPITGYLVYRGTTSDGQTLLAEIANVTTYSDSTAANGITYFYKVAAANGVGEGALSNERSATPANLPGAPALDSATGGNGSVALTWTPPGSNGGAAISGYRVYRGTSAGAETLLTTVGNVTAYTDSTAVNGTAYFYEVSAVNSTGEGARSNEVSATPSTNPNAPTLTAATPGDGSVALAWSAPANGGSAITGYNVYRGTSSGGETLLTQLGNVAAYTDTTAVNGTTYFYEVAAVNPRGESPRSNERSATPATPPGAPNLTGAAGGNATVDLAWSAPASNGGAAITGYRVYRGTVSGGETLLTTLGNVTSFTDTTVSNRTTYFYEVTAVNGAGEGARSNERSATPLNPGVRDIAGSVFDTGGGAAAGIAVRACLGATCLDTTTDGNGGYAFVDVAPGVYVVRALPTDPSLLAVQVSADATQQSVRGADLRLMTSGAGASDAGPSTFRVAGCTGGTLHYVATADGVSLGSGDVADGAGSTPIDGVYTIDISSLNPGHAAMLQLDVTITCAQVTETQTAVLFADPSGTVVDDNAGGSPLAGATVTLLDAAGNAIPQGDPRLSPATSANPETSDARGGWGWDVAPGTYRVTATSAGCGTATSGPLTVTPTNPVTNVVLHLACAVAPPTFPPVTPPPATLPDPVQGVNFNVVPISGTVLVNGQVLPTGQQIPFGAEIDATNGIVSITTIGPDGKPQTAFFYGGEFVLTLDPDGVTTLVLKGGNFSVCNVVAKKSKVTAKKKDQPKTKKRKTQAVLAKPAGSAKVVRAVWGTGKGSFRTKGRYSSATVRGTLWYHADRCDGTYTQVNEGVVTVLDVGRKKTLIVRAGHSVLVRPK